MRKLLVLGAALVALLSLVSIAQGINGEDEAHIWFFGNCEEQQDSPYYEFSVSGASFFGGGCRGIGLFIGGSWDRYQIAGEAAYEASERFGGAWQVDYLKAINLAGGETAVGVSYGCESYNDPFAVAPASVGFGLWIALFSVVPCEPEDEEPQGPLLAIAYIDNDTGDGGYNPDVDTLIAKLVDVDSSGRVTDGDAVVTNVYPMDFDASPRGSFTTTVYILSGVNVLHQTVNRIEFLSASVDKFVFVHDPGLGEAYEEGTQGPPTGLTYIQDDLGATGVDDAIQVQVGSPSAPSEAVPEFFQDDPADAAFIDVEIYYLPVD